MKIPELLENAIEEKLNHVKLTELKQYASKLSEKYMYQERTGDTLLNTEIEALAYSIMRMPATYGAVYTALKNTLERIDSNIQSVLDIGAGTGAATWAIYDLLELNTPLDKLEKFKIRVKDMLQARDAIFDDSIIVKFDTISDNGLNVLICSYTDSVDYNSYLAEKEDINYKIMRILQEEHIELAYDTKTVLLKN